MPALPWTRCALGRAVLVAALAGACASPAPFAHAVAPNEIGRCMEDTAFPADSSRAHLPIVVFHGANDPVWNSGMAQQGARAAREHGIGGLDDRPLPARGHADLPDAVLAYFRARLVR